MRKGRKTHYPGLSSLFGSLYPIEDPGLCLKPSWVSYYPLWHCGGGFRHECVTPRKGIEVRLVGTVGGTGLGGVRQEILHFGFHMLSISHLPSPCLLSRWLPRERTLFLNSCARSILDLGEATLCPSEEQRQKLCSGGRAPPPKPRVTQSHFPRMPGDFGDICSITGIICLRTGRVELQEGSGGIPPQPRKG